MFDNTDAISLELLRFRRELAIAPGFDNALRESVERLGQFHHPAFPDVRTVVYLDEHDLTLVSTHLAGQRLSQLPAVTQRRALHPALVTSMIQEITPALAALHSSGPAAAHGALTADRLIFTPERRLCIVEHALGAPLQRLGLSPRALWREFGLLTMADDRGVARMDARTDLVQLGTIALSLLLARAVTLDDVELRLPALLDEFIANAGPCNFAAPLRTWLEHALQLSPHSYRSAREAQDGLKELPPMPSRPALHEEDMNDHGSISRVALHRSSRPEHVGAVMNRLPDSARLDEPVAASFAVTAPAPQPSARLLSHTGWIVAALGILVLAEGAVIARLSTVKVPPPLPSSVLVESPEPGDTVIVDGKPLGTTPLRLSVNSGTRAIRLVRTAAAVPLVEPAAQTPASVAENGDARAIAQAAARPRSGGVRFSSPIPLNVLDGERVLGSTSDGVIVANAGTHQLDLINSSLGYRVHETVTIRAGVVTPIAISPPMGRVSINAEPWAQVLIDGKMVGETPLANIPVSLGEHQVVFRHPQMGERREAVRVRADAPARVSTVFER